MAGDTVKVRRGTFAGGIVITKSIALEGAGARATVIRGGGPVVTVRAVGAATQPTVSLARVRITGGRTSSSPLWDGWGGGTVAARGGGVSVPPGAGFSPGATVSIADSVIDGNRAAPASTTDSGNASCPGGPCAFALAEGGGIDNWGALTLTDTVVARNEVGGPLASDAGGIHVGNGIPTLIKDVRITGNTARAFNPQGEPLAFDAGILVNDSPLTMRDTVIARNHVSSVTATTADTGPPGTAIEADGGGTIEHTRIVGNTVSVFAAGGVAGATGGLAVYNFADHAPLPLTVRGSLIAGNTSRATTKTGTAGGQGGGIINNSVLALHHVTPPCGRSMLLDGLRGEHAAALGLRGGLRGLAHRSAIDHPPAAWRCRATRTVTLGRCPGREVSHDTPGHRTPEYGYPHQAALGDRASSGP